MGLISSFDNVYKANYTFNFDVLLTVHLSIFISVINQLDAQKFCFTISLSHASTCFEHMMIFTSARDM
jgi:hypothetical protein